MEEVELFSKQEEGPIHVWQWVYRTEKSPIWNITQSYMSKKEFEEFMDYINDISKHNPICEFKKIKITKLAK